MPTCYKCGGEIEFRHIDGVVKPIHITGGCWDDIDSSPISSSFTSKTAQFSNHEDCCRPTTCQYCGDQIFFIRHNGGCVWVSRLGWPWPKHPCYYNDDTISVDHDQIVRSASGIEQPILGVVISAQTRPSHFTDLIIVRCENGDTISCLVSYVKEPEGLVGELAILSLKQEKLIIPGIMTYTILSYTIEYGKGNNNWTTGTKTDKGEQNNVNTEDKAKQSNVKNNNSHVNTKENNSASHSISKIQNTTTSKTKFVCEICGQTFAKKKNLRSHNYQMHIKPH